MTARGAKRVLVAGGGVAGLEALLALRDLTGRAAELTLLAPTDDFIYRPMAAAEPFGRGHAVRYPLSELAATLDARVVRGRLSAVDTSWRIAVTANGTSLTYDMLLVAVGARFEPTLHGALTWVPESDPDLLGGFLRDVEEGYSKQIAFVVPPGVAWTLPLYELALMAASRAWSMDQNDVEITIYTPERAPLALLGSRASRAAQRELEQAGVRVRTHVCVFDDALAPGRLILHPRERTRGEQTLDADRVVTLPRPVAPEISGLPRDQDGFIPVDPYCRVRGSGAVWAAGDVTDCAIKHVDLAARQADAAAEAIAAAAGAAVRPAPFQPALRDVMRTARSTHWILHDPDNRAHGEQSGGAARALWPPPPTLVGRYLTPFLAEVGGQRRIEATRPAGLPFSLDLGPALRQSGAGKHECQRLGRRRERQPRGATDHHDEFRYREAS